MKRFVMVLIACVACLAGTLGAGAAAARPAAGHKLAGTIFFFRENAADNGQNQYAMSPKGKSVHKLAHVGADFPVYPAPAAHLLAYTVSTGQFERGIGIATYSGKRKHLYKPKNLIAVYSISPNGKYLGLEFSGTAGKVTFEIATIKGKRVATLFGSASSVPPTILESWSPNNKQLAVMNDNGTTNLGTLRVYNLHGKVVRTLATKVSGSANGLSWSKTGIVAYTTGHDIAEVRGTGSNPHLLIALGANYPDGVSYSPNGAYLAYGVDVASGVDDLQVWRATSSGGSRTEITSKGSQPHWG
jgi:hypothetical protein